MVDDNIDVRQAVAALLELSGHGVITASDGAEALERLRERSRPDLILLDLFMAGMDGWEFDRRRRGDPSWSSIPVIVMSGSVECERTTPAIHADGYLRKPFDIGRLLDWVDRYAAHA